ncbi:MAG TPA: hypothetical protein VK714_16485 [Myxococcota bacterium]|nr:hypothetical protein [Myxococcota bacterium]
MSGMPANRWLVVCAVAEAITGLALLLSPQLVVGLLLGAELSRPGQVLGRLLGFALISLGLACWPGREPARGVRAPLPAMLIYNLFAALYLGYVGIRGEEVGSLLWPAVAFHAVMTLMLFRPLLQTSRVK